MRTSIKTVLPLLLGASPLLIAATPASTASQFTCGLDPVESPARADVELTTFSAQSANSAAGQTVEQRPIAHPVVASFRALVTSEQELSSFLERAVNAATGYWRESPNYSLQFATEAAEQAQCLALNKADTTLENSSKAFAKEDPQGDVIVPPGDIVDDLPVVEPAAGGAQPVESVEPTAPIAPVAEPTAEPAAVEPAPVAEPAAAPQPSTQPSVQPSTQTEDPTQVPAATLVPAQPAVEAIAAPEADPNNYTPDSQSPTPFSGIQPDSLQTLPDGSYRYINGRYENRAYSDEVLRSSGRSIFLLTKTGNEVVGRLMPQLGEPGLCVDGTLSGNTVMGSAYPEVAVEDVSKEASEATTEPNGEFVALGETGLQVREPVTLGEQTLYSDALLDLNNFSRINAGSAIAPTACLSIPTAPTELQTPTEGSIEASETEASEPAENRASLPAQ